jgi:hypothetical protein
MLPLTSVGYGRASSLRKLNINDELSGLFFSSKEE